MFLWKGRWMQFVLVMAQWEGLKGRRASKAPEPIVSVFIGPVFWVSGRFTESFFRWSDSSWENTHCLPAGVSPLIPLGQSACTHIHKSYWSNEIHTLLIEMHACRSHMHSYMIMICTWNHTLTYNEKDLKRAVIFTISLTVTHAHTHKSVHMYTSAAVHSYTSIHRFFHPVLRLLEAAICSLFLPFVPFLSSLWLIKSPVLWYTAKPPGHFYGLLGPLFLSSFHCFNPPKKWAM